MLGSTILIWMIFSLTIDYFLKNRIQLALGRKKYHTKNHVIVCGLGRLGYFIVEELLKREKKVIIIEINEEAKHVDYFRSIGADVYIGDARSEKVLSDVNIKHSAALISVINNDALNIEIGLHARTLYATMKIVLRIFDEDIAVEIKNMLNIQLAMSNSAIASKSFFNELKKYDHEKHSPQ
jgi:Trk K+ transport system NAD-binding subunit